MQEKVEKPAEAATPETAAGPESPADEASAAGTAEPSLEAKLAELEDRHLRTLAEMENTRRRHARELEDARQYAMTGFARDLLDVADNLRRALAAVPAADRAADERLAKLYEGVELTERTLLNAFEKHRVSRIAPERGEKFDHNRHQAMFEQPTDELPPGHVAEVLQTGWVIADRLLRPAMVGVAKAVPKPVPAAKPATEAPAARGTTVDTEA